MIHTLTLNPTLDITYLVEDFKNEDTTRAHSVFRSPGGKGINVSRVVTRLGHPTVALGFVGGHTGLQVAELLEHEGVRCWFVQVNGETRTNPIVQDAHGKHLRVSAPGPSATPEQVQLLWDAVFALRQPNWLLVSGSKLQGVPKDFYPRLIARAQADGVQVVVDADGTDLQDAIRLGVALIKPNRFELERLCNRPLPTHNDVLHACQELVQQGVGAVAASLGPEGAIFVNKTGAWFATPPNVKVESTVGAGDSFLAGLCSQLAENKTPEQALGFAVACGTATASAPGRSLCTPEMIAALLPSVEIKQLV